ncbi:hypothetical protein Tco_1043776 [Tanacetum coccineum]|uniref:Uncharacterized protein n=1 Tax=Tanacetum coccineum TaxID=301880 RepID=A0ABQ5GP92_9ASTR
MRSLRLPSSRSKSITISMPLGHLMRQHCPRWSLLVVGFMIRKATTIGMARYIWFLVIHSFLVDQNVPGLSHPESCRSRKPKISRMFDVRENLINQVTEIGYLIVRAVGTKPCCTIVFKVKEHSIQFAEMSRKPKISRMFDVRENLINQVTEIGYLIVVHIVQKNQARRATTSVIKGLLQKTQEPNCIPEMLKQLEPEPKANIDEYSVDIEKPECLLKDPDGRKVLNVGTQVKVKVSPGVGVGESEQEEIFKDMDDGSYTHNYRRTSRFCCANELPAPMAPSAAQANVAARFNMYFFCCCLVNSMIGGVRERCLMKCRRDWFRLYVYWSDDVV